MLRSFTPTDDGFMIGEDQTEHKDEYEQELKLYPEHCPLTHYTFYEWVPTATEKRPHALPKRVYGVRERPLSEIKELTDNFKKLENGQLRGLKDRYNVPTPDFNEVAGPQDEREDLIQALLDFLDKTPVAEPKQSENRTNIRPATKPGYVLPADIAAMNENELKRLAAQVEAYKDYQAQSGKPLAFRREWVAKRREAFEAAKKAAEQQTTQQPASVAK